MSLEAARDILGRKLCKQQWLQPLSFADDVLTIGHPQPELARSLRDSILQRIPHAAIKIEVRPNEEIARSLDGAWPDDTESNFPPDMAEAFETALDESSEELILAPNPLGDKAVAGSLYIITANARRVLRTYNRDEFESLRVTIAQRAFSLDDPQKKMRGHLAEVIDGRNLFMRALSVPAATRDNRDTAHTQLRLLRPYYLLPNLSRFGFDERSLDLLLTYAGRAATNVVIAAPPGNGKTSLALRVILNFPYETQNGFTIEYPVEVFMPSGITQKLITKDFSRDDAVEQVLGMSPSWVFIGESIEDSTAQLTAKVMATGIPTLTSNHAKDALSIPERMIRQGVPTDAAARANLLVATRLLPELCPECRRKAAPSEQLQRLLTESGIAGADLWTRGKKPDCSRCKGTGTIGRRGVGEVFVVDERARRLIERNELEAFRTYMTSHGLPSMKDLALRRLAEGKLDERDFFANIPVNANAGAHAPTTIPVLETVA